MAIKGINGLKWGAILLLAIAAIVIWRQPVWRLDAHAEEFRVSDSQTMRLSSVAMAADGLYFAGGDAGLYWREKAEGAWRLSDDDVGRKIEQVVTDNDVVIGRDQDGKIHVYRDEVWDAMPEIGPVSKIVRVIPSGVVAIGATEMAILRLDRDLHDEFPLPFNRVNDVAFIQGGTIGVAVGDNGRIAWTTDGGQTWIASEWAGLEHLYDVEWVSTETLVAAGASGTLLRSENAGKDWFRINSGTQNSLRAMHWPSSTEGIVVGLYGTILRTKDGGVKWRQETAPYQAHLYDVIRWEGFDIAVGWYGTVLTRGVPEQ